MVRCANCEFLALGMFLDRQMVVGAELLATHYANALNTAIGFVALLRTVLLLHL